MHEVAVDGTRCSVTFGSASLLHDDDDEAVALSVLEAALDAGAARLDTAPMYGWGRTEPLVLALGRRRAVPVTTKVGIEPQPRPPAWRRIAASAVSTMPEPVRAAVRRAAGASPEDPTLPSGRFSIDAVRASVERSLRRGDGRLDRLMLHEVQPPDVTDELLALLAGFRDAGDVAELGCATRNVITRSVLERGAGVLTVAHVSTAPLGAPVPSVPGGVRLVGHGALGPGGRDLRRVRRALDRDHDLRRAWSAGIEHTAFEGDDGLVRALLVRSREQVADDVLVATTRRDRATGLVTAAASTAAVPAVAETLERAVARTRRDPRGGVQRAARPADHR